MNTSLSDFGYIVPFRRYSRSNLKLSEIAPNFACFWPPISLGGGSPELLDLHYKAHPDSDQVAKFHGDRPRQLGGRTAKEINKTRNMGQSPTSGRPGCALASPAQFLARVKI